ncbi:Gluconate transport-inducing protein [Fusarium poae]
METYRGYVQTPADAIRLLEACRLGVLPRLQRRLSGKERQSIRSGSVFVWDERETGMRRWTDGKSWSASRIAGGFLIYRELKAKRGGFFSTNRRGADKTADSDRGCDGYQDYGESGRQRYKADGLVKQSFSITTSCGNHFHLISYYSWLQHGQSGLQRPTNDPELRNIVPPKHIYTKSSMDKFNTTPALTREPMQQPPYVAPQPRQQPHAVDGQPGYSRTPSPAATPPYTRRVSHYPPTALQQYPPHVSYPDLPLPNYANTAVYEQPGLLLSCRPNLTQKTLHSTTRILLFPERTNALATSILTLPSPGALANGPTGASLAAIGTPSGRTVSVGPPGNSHFYVSRPSALDAVLHHTPTAGESGSVKPGNVTSSPRASSASVLETGGSSEDAKALKLLDRRFCI